MAAIRGSPVDEQRPVVPVAPAGGPAVAVADGYAGTGRRFAALAIDVGILALLELMLLTPLATVVEAFGVSDDYDESIAEAVLFFAYFGIAWALGKSFGMRILGIRLEQLGGGGPPGAQRALIRAALGVPPLLALFFLLAFAVAEQDSRYSAVDTVLLLAALPVLFAGLGARLTMIRHPNHQSLVDQAAGVVVVRVAPEDAEAVGQPAVPQAPPRFQFAPKGTRFAAFLLDCLFLMVSFPIWVYVIVYPLGVAMGDPGALLGLFVTFVCYFTVGWGRGQTLGMRLAGIRHERADRGGRPGYRRGFVRALLGGTPPLAFLLLVAAGFSDVPVSGNSTFDEVLLLSATGVLIVGPLARLTMIRHPRRQSLVDRAAGVVVVRGTAEAAIAPAQPWQPPLADGAAGLVETEQRLAGQFVPGTPALAVEGAGQEQFAATGTRLVAFFFDVILLGLTVPFWGVVVILPLLRMLPDDLGLSIGLIVGAAAYFAFAWGRGRSLGMRLLSIHLERAEGGGRPGFRRGVIRSLLASTPVTGSLVALVVWADRLSYCQEDPACRPADDFPLLMAGLVLFGVGLGTRLTMRYDPRHQSVIDRAAGVVVVLDPPKQPEVEGRAFAAD